MIKKFLILFSILISILFNQSNAENNNNDEILKYSKIAVSLYIVKYAAVDNFIPRDDLNKIIHAYCKVYLLGMQDYNKEKTINRLVKRDFLVFKGNFMPSNKIDKTSTINTCRYYNVNKKVINNKELSEKYYVAVGKYLNMRIEPNTKSKIIKRIPNGSKIIVVKKSPTVVNVGKNQGRWVKAKYKNTTGYVFDAYLTLNKPIKNTDYLSNIKNTSIKLPKEWRYPTNKELADEPLRKNSSTGYVKTTGDFNNDGIIDSAFLLMRKKGHGHVLAIYISNMETGFSWIFVNKKKYSEKYPFLYGIDIVKPQKGIKTACGKGYWKCSASEVPEIDISFPSISLFYFERADSLVYWSIDENKFKYMILSD